MEKKIIKHICTIAVLALAAITLAACSRSFYIKPAGRIGESIIFLFCDTAMSASPKKFNITELVVQEQVGPREWIPVWEIKGELALDSVIYGGNYNGLTEISPAKTLSPKKNYRVLASEHTWPNPIGYASAIFSIDDNGGVVTSER